MPPVEHTCFRKILQGMHKPIANRDGSIRILASGISKGWLNRHQRGAVTLEFALVAPIVLFVFLFAVEIAAINMVQHATDNAAYEAARTAAMPNGDIDEAKQKAHRVLANVGFAGGAETEISIEGKYSTAIVSVPMGENGWWLSRFSGLKIVRECQLTREEAL